MRTRGDKMSDVLKIIYLKTAGLFVEATNFEWRSIELSRYFRAKYKAKK